jgi:hypothetical protein
MNKSNPYKEAFLWNEEYPKPGLKVRYWTGVREGEGKVSFTRTKANVLGDHTAVLWVEGESGCVALSHVEVERP